VRRCNTAAVPRPPWRGGRRHRLGGDGGGVGTGEGHPVWGARGRVRQDRRRSGGFGPAHRCHSGETRQAETPPEGNSCCRRLGVFLVLLALLVVTLREEGEISQDCLWWAGLGWEGAEGG